jgi:hypothetical protein
VQARAKWWIRVNMVMRAVKDQGTRQRVNVFCKAKIKKICVPKARFDLYTYIR